MKLPARALSLAVATFAGMALIPLGTGLLGAMSVVPGAYANAVDIPPGVVAALEAAANGSGVPWAVLAGIASVATDFGRHFAWAVSLPRRAFAPSFVHSRRSPGWQSSSRQRASSVENRIALALFVFSTDRFAIVMPRRSARSVRVRRRSSRR